MLNHWVKDRPVGAGTPQAALAPSPYPASLGSHLYSGNLTAAILCRFKLYNQQGVVANTREFVQKYRRM
jgi:hypothetical protein